MCASVHVIQILLLIISTAGHQIYVKEIIFLCKALGSSGLLKLHVLN